jgi:hypothetical protein
VQQRYRKLEKKKKKKNQAEILELKNRMILIEKFQEASTTDLIEHKNNQ